MCSVSVKGVCQRRVESPEAGCHLEALGPGATGLDREAGCSASPEARTSPGSAGACSRNSSDPDLTALEGPGGQGLQPGESVLEASRASRTCPYRVYGEQVEPNRDLDARRDEGARETVEYRSLPAEDETLDVALEWGGLQAFEVEFPPRDLRRGQLMMVVRQRATGEVVDFKRLAVQPVVGRRMPVAFRVPVGEYTLDASFLDLSIRSVFQVESREQDSAPIELVLAGESR